MTTVDCAHCGTKMVNPHPYRKFCSSKCRYQARPIAPSRLGSCSHCGCDVQVGERSAASPSCQGCRRRRPPCPGYRCKCEPCKQTRRDDVNASNRKYREEHGEARSTTWRRINGRPERNGSVFEPSTARRLRLYERDNWTCGICHEPTSPTYTATDPWSPTLDHIEPRSHVLIPDHSDAGVRTAHALCNAMRGDDATRDADVRSRVLPMLYQSLTPRP